MSQNYSQKEVKTGTTSFIVKMRLKKTSFGSSSSNSSHSNNESISGIKNSQSLHQLCNNNNINTNHHFQRIRGSSLETSPATTSSSTESVKKSNGTSNGSSNTFQFPSVSPSKGSDVNDVVNSHIEFGISSSSRTSYLQESKVSNESNHRYHQKDFKRLFRNNSHPFPECHDNSCQTSRTKYSNQGRNRLLLRRIIHEDDDSLEESSSQMQTTSSPSPSSSSSTRVNHHIHKIRMDAKDRQKDLISKRLSLPADLKLPQDFLAKLSLSPAVISEDMTRPLSRQIRRQSLSEIGFGKLETYIKLDKLGEVRIRGYFLF